MLSSTRIRHLLSLHRTISPVLQLSSSLYTIDRYLTVKYNKPMSLSQRNDLSRSLERKSLHRDQFNALLYKNIQAPRPKESSLGRTSGIPTSRSKAKSSQGNYPDSESRKHSIDIAPITYDRTGSMAGWV